MKNVFGGKSMLDSVTYSVSDREMILGCKYYKTVLANSAKICMGEKEMYVLSIANMLQYDISKDLEDGLTDETLALIVDDLMNDNKFRSIVLTNELIDEVILAKADNVDTNLYIVLGFSPGQIREIRYGLRDNLNTLCYSFKHIKDNKMKIIREILALDNGFSIDNSLGMEELRNIKKSLMK